MPTTISTSATTITIDSEQITPGVDYVPDPFDPAYSVEVHEPLKR